MRGAATPRLTQNTSVDTWTAKGARRPRREQEEASRSLDLVLGAVLLRSGGRGLEQLDLRSGVLFQLLELLLRLLEGGLQLLKQGILLLLSIGHLLLELSELRIALLSRHGNVFLQFGLLLVAAVFEGVHAAARAQLR